MERVSHRWRDIVHAPGVWYRASEHYGFDTGSKDEFVREYEILRKYTHGPSPRSLTTHAVGTPPMAAPVLTSVAMSRNLVACGTEHGRVHIFDTRTGDVVQVLGAHAGHGADGVWGIWLIDGKGGPAEGSMAEAKAASEGPGPSAVPQSPSTYDGPSSRGGDWLEDMVEDEEEDEPPPRLTHVRNTSASTPPIDAQALYHQRAAYHDSRTTHCTPQFAAGGPLVISVGTGRAVKIWDVRSGRCIRMLPGHASTVRAVVMLPCTCGTRARSGTDSTSTYGAAPHVLLTASRDGTLRTFDMRVGRARAVLAGHSGAVRCIDADLDVQGGVRCVSGGADGAVRVWAPLAHPPSGAVATLAPLRTLHGHHSQIYALAYCGARGIIASGGADTTIRVWDAENGTCLALLQGHTALVCQLSLSPPPPFHSPPKSEDIHPLFLASGGAEGRVMLFSLAGMDRPVSGASTPSCAASILARIPAHDQSITALQVDWRWGVIFTGGADGAARVWDVRRALGVGDRTSDYRDRGIVPGDFSDPEEEELIEDLTGGRPAQLQVRTTGRSSGAHTPVPVTPISGPAYSYARELSSPARVVWKVVVNPRTRETMVVLCQRNGRSIVEVWRMGASKGDAQ
ncbi:WD40 repeat-like protein [Schizophyllum commune Tattone D]|nr:WD40 repeat-like protein [Schizophyllum commune Tattone D]